MILDVNGNTIKCEDCGSPLYMDWNDAPAPQLCEVVYLCPKCDKLESEVQHENHQRSNRRKTSRN